MTSTTQPIRGCPSTTGNERQLNTTTLIRHAARTHGDQEIVYRTPDGGWDRYTYADCYARVCRSANALRALGVEPCRQRTNVVGCQQICGAARHEIRICQIPVADAECEFRCFDLCVNKRRTLRVIVPAMNPVHDAEDQQHMRDERADG